MPIDLALGAETFSIVAIGASAGGLEAATKLLDCLPTTTGMAFILVQHLDPNHESMMAPLLASHTAMSVKDAVEGMKIEPEHLYIIPPATYLSVSDGALRLSKPTVNRGARLPFDHLLRSLAEAYGERVICVILSGTGSDGSLGLKTIRETCGLAIAQDPLESAYGGMPRSAILMGGIDLVLKVAEIPAALGRYNRRMVVARARIRDDAEPPAQPWLAEIIELLKTRTEQDFTLYKPGTLQRRTERRMAMAAIDADDMESYLGVLRDDPAELALLGKDLLISVTQFFRDEAIFELLEKTIIPDIVRKHGTDTPLRIWIAGCSTGEETYSLAMLFREAIAESRRNVSLQVFASDIDADVVARARDGFYPDAVLSDVSSKRLARFFSKEEGGYRVLPELRASVVFTVQDVLTDAPFSRLDFVSCRNLLIYMLPEAQANVIAMFHFALVEDGIMLLGSSESVANVAGNFEVISKSARIYRRIGSKRLSHGKFLVRIGDSSRPGTRVLHDPIQASTAALAEQCRRILLDSFAPAAVLINRKHECLYVMGPTDRYLRVAPGYPTNDILAMAPEVVRSKLRVAIKRVDEERKMVTIAGGRLHANGSGRFNIEIRPVVIEKEELLLICFIDDLANSSGSERGVPDGDIPKVAELEFELNATRHELQEAVRELEIAGEEQKIINEEALSVNEEHQSTNEELVTSKEELQSLNEELTALNSQLHETLERQRTTSTDLQNVLYSTDVATLFLDTELRIRFFTPATKSLFNIIAADVGRPLADLSSPAIDESLSVDARSALRAGLPVEREVETRGGAWFVRRILPYRTLDNGVEGVVITFTDITERKQSARALEAAKQEAESANHAKSRFLNAASHDLRQPLQTLMLLQPVLGKLIHGEPGTRLMMRMENALRSMSGMLDTLLDINQIETGNVSIDIANFPINDMLSRLREEFTYLAEAKGVRLRRVPCSEWVRSDARLLEQMLRNLLANAVKYTEHGKIVLGCRRYEGMLSIEVWDSGTGIPEHELDAIFDEYHQLDNPARERSRGLGLGLAIVKRLGNLLRHRVTVRSRVGRGSVFAIEVISQPKSRAVAPVLPTPVNVAVNIPARRGRLILVVEDDPELRAGIALALEEEGFETAVAADGLQALELLAQGPRSPDLILADYNLPRGMNGAEVVGAFKERMHESVPAIILTGDMSAHVVRDIVRQQCVRLGKPVTLAVLMRTIHELLEPLLPSFALNSDASGGAPARSGKGLVYIVDDDPSIRDGLKEVLEGAGHEARAYASCEEFLRAYKPGADACLLVDAYLAAMSGIELLQILQKLRPHLPAIMITGMSDVSMAVVAMKAGALDFLEKPVGPQELLESIARALDRSHDVNKHVAWRASAIHQLADLTARQHQIMDLVLAGHPSKNIASDLGISQRTVENHRNAIMKKAGVKSLPALVRLVLAAASGEVDPDRSRVAALQSPGAGRPPTKDP